MARRTRHEALIMSLLAQRSIMQAPRFAAAQGPDPEGRTWYRIENRDGGSGGNAPVEVFLYAEIGMWGVSADMFLDELTPLGGRDITLRVNSEGGEVFDGVAIYNALQRHNGQIRAHVDGLAASAASFICMAADEIVMEPGSQMMIHDAIGFCYGNEAEMEKMRGMLARTSDTIAMIYAERAGGEAATWREIMRGERWYDGAGAVDAKLADRVGEGRPRGQNQPDNRVPAGQSQPVNEPVAQPVNDYDPGQARDGRGRWTDGMPDVIAEYAIPTLTGALSARSTRGGLELSDGTEAGTVTLNARESGRLIAAMRNDYATSDVLINRHKEIDGKLYSVTVARVRPSGAEGRNEDGEAVRGGVRLDLGAVEDSDEYDVRQGVQLSSAQAAGPFEDAVIRAESATRVDTGYGSLDMYPSPGGGVGLRMKAESGYPTEVEFSKAEWTKINRAIDTLIDGFDEDADGDGADVNSIVVKTKAGRVELEWKGGRTGGGGYADDARLLMTPLYDAPWSVVIGGEHMSDAFDPIGLINDAIGVSNRSGARVRAILASGRRRVRPGRKPKAIRARPGTRMGWLAPAWMRDTDGSQLRGDDGRWVEFLPDTNSIDMDKYAESYDVYDESTTDAGVTIVTMADGEMQWSMDYADEPDTRDVLLDIDAEDMTEIRDALQQVIDAADDADVTERDTELVDSETGEVWFSASRADGVITVFIPGEKESRDLQIELDVSDAAAVIDAIEEQLARSAEITDTVDSPADTWDRALIALTTPQPVSSPADDHPMAFWETT